MKLSKKIVCKTGLCSIATMAIIFILQTKMNTNKCNCQCIDNKTKRTFSVQNHENHENQSYYIENVKRTSVVKHVYNHVLDSCGEICEVKKEGIPSKFFHFIHKQVDCMGLWLNQKIDEPSTTKKVISFSDVPNDFIKNVTYDNKFPFNNFGLYSEGYLGKDAYSPVWKASTVEEWIQSCGKGTLNGNYGSSETSWLFRGLQVIPNIVDATVLVIGSEVPWVEACILAAGAKLVKTLEYGKIVSEHDQIEIIQVDHIRSHLLKQESQFMFDIVVSFSSIEHVGLGRYGEALNPWGDRQTIARAWCITRPGGYLLLGVPYGQDSIEYNAHRIYGPIQYPHLTANWHQQWQARGGDQRVHLFRKSIHGKDDPGMERVLWVRVNLEGRLGNQLFEAASAYGIAKARNYRYCIGNIDSQSNTMIENSVQFLHYFPACPSDVSYKTVWETQDKGGNQKYVKSFVESFQGENILVGQYLQSYKYFESSGLPFRLKHSAWADNWSSSRGFNAAIHVREDEEGQNTPITYYERAIEILKKNTKEDSLNFFVCSNNFDWVRKHSLFDGMQLVEGYSPGEDMALLSSVPNLLIGWGTFGWWSAYLKRKKGPVVYYNAPWNHENTESIILEDHFLDSWIRVDWETSELEAYRKSKN